MIKGVSESTTGINESQQSLLKPVQKEQKEEKETEHSVMCVFLMAQINCILQIGVQVLFKDAQVTYGAKIPEVTFIRACTYLALGTTNLFIYKKNPFAEVPREHILPLVLRCASSTAALFIVITAIKLVPLTIFGVVTNMTPFVAGLLAWVCLDEKLAIFQMVMMVFCFAGVVVVAITKNSDEDDLSEFGSYELGVALTCLLCLIFAISDVSTRRLKTMHFSVLQFYLASISLMSSLIWLLCVMSSQKVFNFVGSAPWVEIISGSLCDFFSQMLLILMIKSMNPAMVGMFSYVIVFYAFFSDTFIFDMSLSTLQLVGCISVFMFSLAAAYQKKWADDRQKALEKDQKVEATAKDDGEDDFKRT